LASVAYDTKRKVTSRERFLSEMDRVIPWQPLLALIAPHYTPPGRGRRPQPLATTLRVYFLRAWIDLSDPKAEDMLYDSESMRRFARVELGEDTVPNESTIHRFRHLLEQHALAAQIFATVRALLQAQQLLLKAGTIVDATIVAAPSTTKNATPTRDPSIKQTRKWNQWYFGMTVHVGSDTRGIVHTVTTTDAATADITQLDDVLHGEERTLFGDQAYWKQDDKTQWEDAGGIYRINRRGKRTAN
jgi:transposase, IS5 family